jgi:2-polyprenyl-3-methyl-5-hydroxy-6-metoxy-1,4-benzoquinol methylase
LSKKKLLFREDDFEFVEKCPWCSARAAEKWGKPLRSFVSVRCKECGLIYVRNRLNAAARETFYRSYYSAVHQADRRLLVQRKRMYQLEFDFIHSFCKAGRVLDVGCSGGQFLDFFCAAGFDCVGVEFGKEAARQASKKYQVYLGDFPKLKISGKFSLIVFRGVIEHVVAPKRYLTKTIELLKRGGFLYITSTPNSDALCCDLFKEQWNQHEPEAHLMHFSAKQFDPFCEHRGLHKLCERHFYLETPYANIQRDLPLIATALQRRRAGKSVDFRSPPFFGNMMSLIYQKR